MAVRARSVFGMFVLFTVAACASAPAGYSGFDGAPGGNGVIEVDNRTLDDLTIYMGPEEGRPVRIGRVQSLSKRSIVVPSALLAHTTLQLRAARGRGNEAMISGFIDYTRVIPTTLTPEMYVTYPFMPHGTAKISWAIEPKRVLSSVMIAPG
jgi:hypothetical protein